LNGYTLPASSQRTNEPPSREAKKVITSKFPPKGRCVGRRAIRRRARPTAMRPTRKATTAAPLVPSSGVDDAASGAATAAATTGSRSDATGGQLAASALAAVVSAARRLAVSSFRVLWPGCSLDCVPRELWPNNSKGSFPNELPARVPRRCALLLLRGSTPEAAVPEGARKGAPKGATKGATKVATKVRRPCRCRQPAACAVLGSGAPHAGADVATTVRP